MESSKPTPPVCFNEKGKFYGHELLKKSSYEGGQHPRAIPLRIIDTSYQAVDPRLNKSIK